MKKDLQPEKKESILFSIACNSPCVPTNKLQNNFSLLEKTYGTYDDKTIWSKFKNGDKAAFTHIYYEHFAMLCRYGSQFIANKELVKDHIHDLFIELSESREKLSATNSIKFYLMKSLKNRMIAARRKQKVFLDDKVTRYDFDISFSIEQIMIHNQYLEERNQRLNKAIAKLSKRQREVIYYFYFEELSLEEITELMDCGNAKSIQNLLYRAIHHLQEYVSL